jgi:hypothetical protein
MIGHMAPAGFATDPAVVAEQAALVAAAWSPPGAPSSWRLTAAQFEVLRDDPDLLAVAATIPPDRLPPLLFQAAATFLVLHMEPQPLRDAFPRLGQPQPPVPDAFPAAYREFCLDQREALIELTVRHRYQMNEVGRCAGIVPALADGRETVLVDVGTGAGLALHLDRYRYRFTGPDGHVRTAGDPAAPVAIETATLGRQVPPLPPALPPIVDRVGIDAEPLNVGDPAVRDWLAACIPQEAGAVTRFHQAAEVALAHPARTVRGDAAAVLPDVLAGIPSGPLVCVIDSYASVFFAPDELRRFRAVIERAGAARDLDWISIDPLVPMGEAARHSVAGVDVPPSLVERNRRDGVFGVIGRLSYRQGRRSAELLGVAHPGASWLEWLAPQAEAA